MMLFVNQISRNVERRGPAEARQKEGNDRDILHRFHVIVSPNFTSPIVILWWARFVFQGIIEGLDRWELGFREFVTFGHIRIWIDSLCKNQIAVTRLFCCVVEFIATTYQQQRHKVVQECGKNWKVSIKRRFPTWKDRYFLPFSGVTRMSP